MSKSILQSYWTDREVVRREAARSGNASLAERLAWQDVLRRHLPVGRGGMRVLDAGCGAGVLPSVLAGYRAKCTAVDLSQPLLNVLSQRAEEGGYKLDVMHGDVAALDLPNAMFDAITAVNVLSLAERPREMLAEWMRLLAPKGVLLLIEDDRDSAEFPLFQQHQLKQSESILEKAWRSSAEYLPLWNARSSEFETVLVSSGWHDVTPTRAAGQLARTGRVRRQTYSLGYQIITAKKGGSIPIR